MDDNDTEFGDGLIEGLREALAWKRGEITLEVVEIDPSARLRIEHNA